MRLRLVNLFVDWAAVIVPLRFPLALQAVYLFHPNESRGTVWQSHKAMQSRWWLLSCSVFILVYYICQQEWATTVRRVISSQLNSILKSFRCFCNLKYVHIPANYLIKHNCLKWITNSNSTILIDTCKKYYVMLTAERTNSLAKNF